MKKLKIGWYSFKKTYQGSSKTYVLYVNKIVKENFGDTEESLSKYIGENTNGGHNYGWEVYVTFLGKNKPEGEKLVFLIAKEVTTIQLVKE